jgi:hypothetical protein
MDKTIDVKILDSSEVKALKTLATKTINQLQEFKLKTISDLEIASGYLVRIADHRKGLEGRRKFFVDPLNKHVKDINDYFKSLDLPLQEADRQLRRMITEFRELENKKREEKEIKLQEKAEEKHKERLKTAKKNGDDKPIFVAPVVPKLETTIAGITSNKVWTFEVVSEKKIPEEYIIPARPDETKIREAIRNGIREIPGIRIFQKESLRV